MLIYACYVYKMGILTNVMRLIPTTGKKFKLDGIDQMVEIEAVWEDYFNQTWDSVKEFLK